MTPVAAVITSSSNPNLRSSLDDKQSPMMRCGMIVLAICSDLNRQKP